MAAVATERVNGYHIQHLERSGRADAHMASPDSRDCSRDVSPMPRNADFPRSASYTYLPHAKESPYTNPSVVTIKGSFSEADLIAPADELVDISPPDSSGWTTPEDGLEHEPKVPIQESRDLIAELQKSPKITVQRMNKASEDDESSSVESSLRQPSTNTSLDSSRTTPSTTPGSVTPRARPSFSRKASRKSWYGGSSPSTSSRSPSPAKSQKEITTRSKTAVEHKEAQPDAAPTPPPVGAIISRKSLIRRRDSTKSGKEKKVEKEASQTSEDHSDERPSLSRRSTLLRKKTRPITNMFGASKDENSIPPVPPVPDMPSLPKSFSTDKLPMMRSQPERAAPMPRLVSSERVVNSGLSIPIRKKDELWGAFRGLDGDYAKFASKSVAFKANVVRSALLPFLRLYATHPSNRTLRPEDLDRRANILNKWWTGLIEMLHGRNNQSISGTDRPVILDGISGIMERPEWRLAPSPFCPLNQRMKGTASPRSRSTTSLSSGASEFLTESVYHNVRNIYIQNLSAQMAFVVDKMSLRNASASLVTFCGKACAYAFMFVPGMADILVRLWDLQMDVLRRVLDENGIGKFDNLSETAENTISSFPPELQQLGFVSLMKYMRRLRTPPPLPLGTGNIQWWGHWLERWSGRESDLFYVFVKHFHILVTDFLPMNSSIRERMCAPGVLLVHAQILTNLDATIHREASSTPQDSTSVGQSPTFDDVLGDPDAVASALPLPPTNAIRIMAENRLIMLIRDFLSDRTPDHPIARQLFAESFNALLQTAARGTSVFDHAACYTLLDFLEEALVILVRYEHLKESEGTLINSEFWQTVCKKMISSQNTMTEIRLYAFLYTIWNTVVCDLGRKADLCIGLLLDPEIFESRFNHWCPMVRAYFMRLLCWRVGRFDGESAPGDVLILETMLQRLHETWSYYLYLREQSAKQRALPTPTNPCNPAPGRRLLIVRTDAAPGGSFLAFDLSSRATPPQQPVKPLAVARRFSTMSQVVDIDVRPETPRSVSADSDVSETRSERGFGSFFRKMMGSKTPSRSSSRTTSPTRSIAPSTKPAQPTRPAPQLSNGAAPGLTRSATDDISQAPRQRNVSSESATRPQTVNQHRNFCFKFSLEYHPNTKHVPGPMRLQQPRLPMPAQHFLHAHSRMNLAAPVHPREPKGDSKGRARYAGRALAEWTLIVVECQSFFERRKNEGVPGNKFVETPTLGVEVFRRPS